MAKLTRDNERRDNASRGSAPSSPSGAIAIVTLVGVAAAVVVSAMTWSRTRTMQEGLDARLGKIEGTLTQIATRPPQQAQQQPQRPDPNRSYPIKTTGAPSEGPATAAVTIAEFSEFQ